VELGGTVDFDGGRGLAAAGDNFGALLRLRKGSRRLMCGSIWRDSEPGWPEAELTKKCDGVVIWMNFGKLRAADVDKKQHRRRVTVGALFSGQVTRKMEEWGCAHRLLAEAGRAEGEGGGPIACGEGGPTQRPKPMESSGMLATWQGSAQGGVRARGR
jgi:hypothetical protein